jgi:cellulose synthase (UDP-forming)
MGPENLGDYFKQQHRWALGNVSVLRTVFVNFIKNPKALAPLQWFEYFLTGSYYFVGWAYLLLVLFPVFYVFFNIPSFFMDVTIYSLSFFPYFFLSLGIYLYCMSNRHYQLSQMLRAQALSFITLPVYARASLMGLLGLKASFQVTGKTRANTISYWNLKPLLLLWALNLMALTWGLNRVVFENDLALWTNLFWIGYHFALLSTVFYFNEDWTEDSRAFRPLRWGVSFDFQKIRDKVGIEPGQEKHWIYLRRQLASEHRPGDLLMCKMKRKRLTVVFDAVVMRSKKLAGSRYDTALRVVRITPGEKDQLQHMLR